MSDKKRIVLTGGGTGGHIFPLVDVAEACRRECGDVEFLYIGTRSQMGDLAEQVMNSAGIPTKNVMTGKMRRYFSLEYVLDLCRIPMGIVQSLWHLLVFMPDVVFSKGGYAAIPVIIAARMYRIRVLTHDSDAVPGWANRVGGKLSYYVALSYVTSRRYFLAEKTLLTGNPVGTAITQGDRERGYKRWNFTEARPTVFVCGGSQGARAINEAVLRILPELAKIAQVLHITGKDHYEKTIHLAGEYGFKSGRQQYFAVPFLDREEMADAYAIADIVVSRAGANSITEIAANQKVAILIPLPNSANDHQHMNAYEVAKMGGAWVLEEDNIGSNLLLEKILELLHSKELRTKIQESVRVFYHPDAATKIAAGLIRMIEEK